MKKSNVFFRADGGSQIGLGHMVRCMALAQMLKQKFDITFVCKELPENTAHDIETLGFRWLIIDDEKEFLTLLKSDDIVVLDHYGLGATYQQQIKATGSKLACIDDLHDKAFFADAIINHAPGVTPSDYSAQTYTQYALGLDYVLLRPAFLNKGSKAIHRSEIQSVFVCFGGADSKNLTLAVVNILKTDSRFKNIIIVTGAAYNYMDELKESIKHDTRISLHHTIDADGMFNLMAKADLAIIPASGILQEALAIGLKIVSGMYVENQKYLFNNYKALGVFESAGNFEQRDIIKAINLSFDKEAETPKILIDGKSGQRLLNLFIALNDEHKVILMRAGANSVDKTFEWANDSEVRKFSFTNNPIGYAEHSKWYYNKIEDASCYYYLAELENKVFGSIRFDVAGAEAKISYLIEPGYQNKGLGTILLKKGLDLFIRESPANVRSVWGEVFHTNIASVKIFKKLGYNIELNSTTGIISCRKFI